MEWQVALLALVIVVIVVILLYCFLGYCAKERSFDELIKENSGISLLLSEDAKKAAAKREKLKTAKKVGKTIEEKHNEKQTTKVVTTTTVESIIVAEEEQVSQQPEVGVDGNQLVRRKRNKKGKERLSQGESGVNAAEEQPLDVVESHPHSETREEKIEAVITTTSPPTAEQEVKKKAKKDKKNKLKAEKSADSIGDDKADSTRNSAPLASVENVNLSEGDFNDVLVDQLSATSLSKRQVEVLIESLQSKYSKHIEWYQTHQKNEQVSVLKRQLAEKEQQLVSEATFCQSLKKQLNEARGEVEIEKAQHAAVEKSMQNLSSQRTALEQRQMELTRSYNQSMQQMQAQYQKMCEHQQQLENENKHLKECFTRSEAEKVRVSAQLQQAQMDMSNHDQKLRAMEQDLIRYRDRCSDLETKSVHVHMQDGAVSHQLTEATRLLHEKEGLLKKSQEESVSLRKELESLNTQLLKHSEADKTPKENGEITHELDRLRKENDGNLRKLKEAKAAASAFTEKIYTLETELSSAKPQAEQLRQTVSQLNAELAEFAALKSSTAQLQQELSQLKSERSQLEHKVANQELVLRSSTESTVVIDQRSKALEIELEKLRRECEAERVTREQFKSQLDTKAHSDEIRYKELESALNAKNKMEAELLQLKTDMDSLKEKESGLHNEIDSLKKNTEKLSKECESLATSKKQLAAELAIAKESAIKMAANQQKLEEIQVKVASQNQTSPGSESELTAALRDAKLLKEQIGLLEDAIVGRDKTVTKLESELCDWQHRFKDAERSLSEARGEVTRLVDQQSESSKQLQNLRNENISLLEQLRNLEMEKLTSQEEINGEAEGSVNGHGVNGAMEQFKAEANKECISLKQLLMQKDAEISTLKLKNNELREKNYKVVEAIGVSEKNTGDLVHKKVAEVEEKYKQLLNEQRNLTRQAMAKIAPDVDIPESSENYREWLHEIETIFKKEIIHHYHKESSHNVQQSKKDDKTETTLQKRLDETIKEKLEVESQLSHFKSVLSQTEDMLRKLEDSVEHEQAYLRQKCESLQQELSRVKLELSNSLSKSSTDTLVVREIETLKQQLVEIHTKSELWEKERIHFTTIIDKMTTDLETERATGRDLSAQAVKLRGMLKTGQDALRQEQELVAQLQKQLQNHLSNGVPNGGSGKMDSKGNQSLDEELKDLRTKLAERESQLERELMTNKQLNSKLASLGMPGVQHSS